LTEYLVTVDGQPLRVKFGPEGEAFVDGLGTPASILKVGRNLFSVVLDGESIRILAERSPNGLQAFCGGAEHAVTVETERTRLLKAYGSKTSRASRKMEIHAPMPALIVKVLVSVGDIVEEGQSLLVLEAMKMENELKADFAGKVKQVSATKGKAVEKGELLLVLE
jgi:biotin carboxyl carrier protein